MPQLKSHIDWNELFPLMSKELRETMVLEAITILGGFKRRNSQENTFTRSHKEPVHGGYREWNAGPYAGTKLVAPGRKYIINREAKGFKFGRIGNLWRTLVDSKHDTVSYEDIYKLLDNDTHAVSRDIWTMWSRGAIDVKD